MKYKKTELEYLYDQKFSTGYKFKLQGNDLFMPRIDLLIELCKNKRVLHFGCTDHLGEIDQKIEDNTWLHKLLCENALSCVGVDINKESVEYVQSLGYKDIYCVNLLDEDSKDIFFHSIKDKEFDFILMGEIIEHLDDPVLFLSELKKSLGGKVNKLIVTAPNAFFYLNFKNVFKGIESINTDHKYWYTPFTLAKNFARAGVEIDEIYLASSSSKRRNKLIAWFYKRFYLFRDTVIAVGKLK